MNRAKKLGLVPLALVHHLRDEGVRYGLQTMCEGGGMANASIFENLRAKS